MKRAIKLLIIFLLLLSVSVTSCSCLHATSLEKYGYVITIGIDKGEVYKYNVSFLLESGIKEGDDQSESATNIVSAEADNIYNAIYTAESGLPYRLNFARTNYIIVGFDIGADNQIMDFFSLSWAHLKIRTSANMILSMTTAKEFMEGLTYTSELNITKLENSLIDFYEMEGLTSMISITDFLASINNPRYDAVVPLGCVDKSINSDSNSDTTEGVPRTGGMISYTLGSALFSGSTLKGVISGVETQMLLLIKGELESAAYQFMRKDGTSYSVVIGNSQPPITKVDLDADKIKANIYIPISLMLAQDNSEKQTAQMRNSGGISDEMREQIEHYLKSTCITLCNHFRELNCDAVGIGKYASMKFKTVKAWEEYDFRSKISNIEYSFNIDFEIIDVFVSTYME